ncbi:MAG: glutamate 5-kinase [Synergistales bacterium]|nr:glutamate 5-kinase [Synergistales bacterium]
MSALERKDLGNATRIVVKVGTSSITHSNGKLDLLKMEKLARDVSDLRNMGKEVIIVSSGAVGAGIGAMDYRESPLTLPLMQALSAVGQGALMHMYEKFFSEYSCKVAQVLLTWDIFDDRLKYLNACNTLGTLLDLGVIPIINENDTVVVDELKFGDNDKLSAMVGSLVNTDLLIILTDIDGLYDDDPRKNPKASFVRKVEEITPEMETRSGTKGSSLSSGGMYTKLQAAKMTMASGIPLVIANHQVPRVVRRIVEGEDIGTLFVPKVDSCQARKRWIAFGRMSQGSIQIDQGAVKALTEKGKSLLPSGVVSVSGKFSRGTVVHVLSPENRRIAKGVVNYSAEEISRIAGKQTDMIADILGHKDYDEVIHRDNLVIL